MRVPLAAEGVATLQLLQEVAPALALEANGEGGDQSAEILYVYVKKEPLVFHFRKSKVERNCYVAFSLHFCTCDFGSLSKPARRAFYVIYIAMEVISQGANKKCYFST